MTAPGRVPCCVPGCRRSFRADTCKPGVSYICARCFKLADARARRRYHQIKRRARMIGKLTSRRALDALFDRARALGRNRVVSHHIHDRRLRAAMARAWDRIVADAEIKLAMGVEGAPRRRSA